ncbi:MAG: hypothetical protein Q8O91_11510 [Candidatus Aminicenantes bacterium]|nr:hypothetical protein [Candidatus Aminicenantes bacterium]
MTFSKRFSLLLCLVLAVSIFIVAGAQKTAPPAKTAMKKVESTDPALRFKWFDQYQAMKTQTPLKDMKWRHIGPFDVGGRCTDVEVPKGSRLAMYVGTATGGVWKTDNAGVSWTPITDELPTLSIGDLAISESNPNIVWVGTGEANHFRASIAGIGVYKSTDAGKTWTNMGLAATQTIGRILVHPTNPDIVYVAGTGHEWTYNPDRGVFKTTDGGKTWQKVLYINEKIGAIDLVMDPTKPDILIASMVNRIRLRWSDPTPGGEGLFKTTDGGKTWKPVTTGLPADKTKMSRIGLTLCRTKPNVVYAFVDNHTPTRMPPSGERDSYGRLRTYSDIVGAEVYRSDDQGETWRKVSPADQMFERFGGTYGWVFGQIRVDPNNADVIYLMGLGLSRSIDSGKTWERLGQGVHGDHHGLWIDPADSSYLINVNDGGAYVSYDYGKNWRSFQAGIPATQFYNVAYDMQKPFAIYGSVQDFGSYRGLGVAPLAAQAPGQRRRPQVVRWETAPGGEGSLIAVDPNDPNTEYASGYYGRVERSVYKDGAWTSKEIYPKSPEGETVYRGQWLAGLALSPHNPQVIYCGFQFLFRSMNKGETWEKISPDLTTNNPEWQGKLPYAIPYETITAIAESPFKFGVVYVGTDDGRVHVTKDGGLTWTEITAGLPYNKHVWNMVASNYDPATVYIAQIGREDDDFAPYLFKSTDYGKTWVSIAANIPGGPTNVIREDPKKKDVLYCGTDQGVFVTTDGAKTWNYLGSGLPNAPVWDLQIHPRDNMLVIATNGRGMWIIDDVSPVQK